ncbi:MAG: ferrous iron transport protein A [Candidatus Bipolaricaulaceae bacterium]
MVLNSTPVPLTEAIPGQVVRVQTLTGPGRAVRLRLASLGIRPGARLTVLARGPGGPLLLEVEGCRVALGRGLARRILVLPEPQGSQP